MNTEMSGGSEGESSDDEAHMGRGMNTAADSDDDEYLGRGGALRDDDDEEEDDDALPDEEEEQQQQHDLRANNVEDEDDEDDEDDEEEDTANAAPALTMHKWLKKPNGASAPKSKGKTKAAAASAIAAPVSATPLTQASTKGSKRSRSARPKAPMAQQASNDSGDDLASMTMTDLSRPPRPQFPPDAMQEFDDHRAGLSSSAPADDAGLEEALTHACVHKSAHERVYIIRNEKVNKWFLFNPEAFVYAPDVCAPESSGLFDFTTEQLNIPSKKDRVAMQEKLIDAHGTQAVNTACIAKLKTDGSGSGAGPAMHTLAMLLPGKKVPLGAEMDDIKAKMKQLGMHDGHKEIVVLMLLDHDMVKRLYKIDKNPLPSAFNPNTNSATKYKVPSRLEETAKVDPNFVLIGAAEKARRVGKRTAEERPNGSKRPATENGREDMDARHETAASFARTGDVAALTEFNGREIGLQNCKAWSLTCDEDDMYSLFQTTPGKWVLFRGKF